MLHDQRILLLKTQEAEANTTRLAAIFQRL